MEKTVDGIYLITESVPDLFERVSVALQGGVRIVQYREKFIFKKKRLALARLLRELCREHKALFIVNDDCLLARDCNADGVHLGQCDASLAHARKVLGHQAIIGVSTHSCAEAIAAEQDGADYIGFGCLFPTRTKGDIVSASLEELARVRKAVSIPVVGIGGLNVTNAADVIRAGANAVAVISAVMQADDCAMAVIELFRQYRLGLAERC